MTTLLVTREAARVAVPSMPPRRARTPMLTTLPIACTGTDTCPLPHEADTFAPSRIPSRLRAAYTARYGFWVPTPEIVQLAVTAIAWAGATGALEVGAGAGYFAALLAREGVDVIATDPRPPAATHHPVARANAVTAIQSCADVGARLLVIAWPPLNHPMAVDALDTFTGDHLLYIGEGAGDCCASEAFFAALALDWERVTDATPTRWDGIRDTATLYRRAHHVL